MSIAEKLITIAENEQKVYEAGFEAGKAQGGGSSDDFWDSYQQNGNLRNYKMSFAGKGWSKDNFYPKYDIIVSTAAVSMFQEFGGEPFSLTERLNECGVTLDFSQLTTSASNVFYGSPFTEIPHINLMKSNSIASLYYNCKNLVTASLTIPFGASLGSSFSHCTDLENLTFVEGIDEMGAVSSIGSDVSFKWSTKLSRDSLLSILKMCRIFTGGGEWAIKITLPIYCIDGATNTEALMSESGDQELYTAKMNAINSGYNIVFA